MLFPVDPIALYHNKWTYLTLRNIFFDYPLFQTYELWTRNNICLWNQLPTGNLEIINIEGVPFKKHRSQSPDDNICSHFFSSGYNTILLFTTLRCFNFIRILLFVIFLPFLIIPLPKYSVEIFFYIIQGKGTFNLLLYFFANNTKRNMI